MEQEGMSSETIRMALLKTKKTSQKLVTYPFNIISRGPLFHGTDRTGPNLHTILRNGPDHG